MEPAKAKMHIMETYSVRYGIHKIGEGTTTLFIYHEADMSEETREKIRKHVHPCKIYFVPCSPQSLRTERSIACP